MRSSELGLRESIPNINYPIRVVDIQLVISHEVHAEHAFNFGKFIGKIKPIEIPTAKIFSPHLKLRGGECRQTFLFFS